MKMKILSLAAVLALGATSAFSQGTINFANSGTTLVTTNSGTTSGNAGLTTTSGIKVALFYQADPNGSTAPVAMSAANPLQGNWELIGTLANISPLAGRFSGGQLTTGTDVAPAGNVWLEVVAWSGGAQTSLANALANSAYIGYSSVWSQGTGDGGSVGAVSILAPTGGFNGLVMNPVPEPSTIALGGLGAAALLLFRRRK